MRCVYTFDSSGMLFMSTQSYFLSGICVTVNQLHSYCPPIVILTASKLHKYSMYSLGSAQKFVQKSLLYLYAISP